MPRRMPAAHQLPTSTLDASTMAQLTALSLTGSVCAWEDHTCITTPCI